LESLQSYCFADDWNVLVFHSVKEHIVEVHGR